MKYFRKILMAVNTGCLFSVAACGSASVKPVTRSIEWEPSCGGAVIEVTSDGGKMVKVVANSEHSASARTWIVDFGRNGRPIAAAYEEFRIDHSMEGEHAGEPKGMTSIRKESWKAADGKFPIKDDRLAKDLADVLSKAEAGS